MAAATVRVTENFVANFEAIRRFLGDGGESERFIELGGHIFETVIPNLERFPELGVDLLARPTTSVEAQTSIERLRERLADGDSVREYITSDYLVLYAVRGGQVFLLAIKHHRQLSYDFRGNWGI